MRQLASRIMVLASCWLAWSAWHPPITTDAPVPLRLTIPNIQPLDRGDWRVITRRMAWKKAAESMAATLKEAGFSPVLVTRDEPIELHAFDDAQTFTDKKLAYQIKTWWEEHHIAADIAEISNDAGSSIYHVTLGRYYLTGYAEQAQKELAQVGRAYMYEKRMVEIPGYRFAFPSMPKSEAEILWRQLQNLGIADPVLMQESEFEKLYAISDANRSNK